MTTSVQSVAQRGQSIRATNHENQELASMKIYDKITVHTHGDHTVFKNVDYGFDNGFLIITNARGYDEHVIPLSTVKKITLVAPDHDTTMNKRAAELVKIHGANLIEAIKLLRNEFNLDLKGAKDLVDKFRE